MRTLRIRRLTIVICIVTVVASSTVCRAYADSISQKWAAPTSTAPKKNPIAPTEASIAAGGRFISNIVPRVMERTERTTVQVSPILAFSCSGSAILAFEPNLTVRFWKITAGKNRCRDTASDSPKPTAGT